MATIQYIKRELTDILVIINRTLSALEGEAREGPVVQDEPVAFPENPMSPDFPIEELPEECDTFTPDMSGDHRPTRKKECKPRKKWSDSENRLFHQMLGRGVSKREIADHFGITAEQCKDKIKSEKKKQRIV